jgi:hypothetical protein
MDRLGPIAVVAGGLLLALLGSVLLLGCVATQAHERPFSHEWYNLQQVNAELERRQAHIDKVDEIVLVGTKEEGGAYVEKNEDGDPKLNIGRDTGLKMDLDYDGGPEAGLKYELKWDAARPGKTRP